MTRRQLRSIIKEVINEQTSLDNYIDNKVADQTLTYVATLLKRGKFISDSDLSDAFEYLSNMFMDEAKRLKQK